MRRTLLLLAAAAVLTLPAAAGAVAPSNPAPGFLVVRNASADGGVNGSPVATVVVRGFVLGRIAQEGAVEIYNVASPNAEKVTGVEISRRAVRYHALRGFEYSGSDFRFRAVGGVWRVVVHGAGVYLYAGGEGPVSLHGQRAFPRADGKYSFNGEPFASLPTGVVKRSLEAK